ncbi:MAG: DUF1636 domain-containing protein [Pseudomonadota bacterium]
MTTQHDVCLSVCTRCRPPDFSGADERRPGYRLAGSILDMTNQIKHHIPRFTLRGVRCMSQCKRPCVIALSAPSKFTLLFGDLNWRTDAEPVLALAHQYAASSDGYVARAQRPAPLRAGILGRVPPLHHAGEGIDPDFAFISTPEIHEVAP